MVHLQPPAWSKNELPKLSAAGVTASATFSPRNNSLAVHSAATKLSTTTFPAEQSTDVYFATVDRVPSPLRRDFITDTYITFVKYTRQVKDLRDRDVALLQGEDALTMYSNIADDYLVALSAHIEALEVRTSV